MLARSFSKVVAVDEAQVMEFTSQKHALRIPVFKIEMFRLLKLQEKVGVLY